MMMMKVSSRILLVWGIDYLVPDAQTSLGFPLHSIVNSQPQHTRTHTHTHTHTHTRTDRHTNNDNPSNNNNAHTLASTWCRRRVVVVVVVLCVRVCVRIYV